MGAQQGKAGGAPGIGAKIGKDEVKKLQSATKFNRVELMQIFKDFITDAPSGVIDRATFLKTMSKMGIEDKFLQDLVFGAFDHNHDGVINFREFVTALSVMTRGSLEEKLGYMYDLNGDGFISREELTQIISSFYSLVGHNVAALEFKGEACNTPQEYVNKFFAEMDENNDGKISFEEYRNGALKNPDIMNGLNVLG